MADEWLTVAQAAELIGYHADHIRRLIRAGKIDADKFATVWRVDRRSLLAYIKAAEKQGEKRGPKAGA
jgi:excisionase family DNA binding protein